MVVDHSTPLCQECRFIYDIVINLIKAGETEFLSSIYVINIRIHYDCIFVVSHK